MTLTEAGAALAGSVPAVLDSWGSALRTAKGAAARADRVLRIGFVASGVDELTQQIIAAFARRRPGWRVQLHQTAWDDPTAGLAAGDSDAALLRLPFPGQEALDVEVLITEDRWVALPAGHRLAGQEVIAFADLFDEPFVATPEESGWWREYWLASDERDGHPVTVGAVAHNPDEWLNAIANGYGVSLTPEATSRFYRRPDVVYRPVSGVSPSRVGVAWPRTPVVPDAVRDFVRGCVELRPGAGTGPTAAG